MGRWRVSVDVHAPRPQSSSPCSPSPKEGMNTVPRGRGPSPSSRSDGASPNEGSFRPPDDSNLFTVYHSVCEALRPARMPARSLNSRRKPPDSFIERREGSVHPLASLFLFHSLPALWPCALTNCAQAFPPSASHPIFQAVPVMTCPLTP